MSQDVKLHIFQQIHTPSGNRLTDSYFHSVTGYNTQTSFTALIYIQSELGVTSYFVTKLHNTLLLK